MIGSLRMIKSQWDTQADWEPHGDRIVNDLGCATWRTFVVSGLAYQKWTMHSSSIHSVQYQPVDRVLANRSKPCVVEERLI